jgi:hypothetical protein
MDGNPRIINGTVDMGAYEFQGIVYVDDDAPDDPGPGDPSVSDPLEDGTQAHPFDTIQEGIDAAGEGDTVMVADGGYSGPGNRDIDFLGKAITVRSENGPENCTIDCENNGRGFYFHSSEDTNSVVSGFTIKRGNIAKGGGIYCSGSSPTIENCTIKSNNSEDGGGVYCTSNSNPVIINCSISNNKAQGLDGEDWGMPGESAYGGGIYCSSDSQPTIKNCTVAGNECRGGDGYGGSIGGGGEGGWAFGGGIYCSLATVIDNCTLTNNTAVGGSGGDGNPPGLPGIAMGGGVYCGPFSSMILKNCIISGNTADDGGGLYNSLDSSSLTVTNCTFSGNSAAGWAGGGLFNESSLTLTNCTFTGNSAIWKGGGIFNLDSEANLINCILWGDTAPDGREIALDVSSIMDVNYCDVAGGQADVNVGFPSTLIWGVDNINEDPCFVDADGPDDTIGTEDDNLRLQPSSPCIDAGNNNTVPPLPSTDLDGNLRIVNGIVDMGAYEFQGIVYVDDDAPDDPGPGDPNISDPLENGTQAHPFDTIQEGIDVAQDGYTVQVYPGQYLESDPNSYGEINFLGKNITLTSTNPTDPNIVNNTIIGGTVLFDGTEDESCTLTGFKIYNLGYGAIYGENTQATISYCDISGNGPCGATVIKDCNGTISNCLITDNTTVLPCGVDPVVFGCSGFIKNCTIANNASGLSVGNATIENCIIYNNNEGGSQIAVDSAATLNISYCNVQGGLGGIVGAGTVNWGPGNIDTDPCFAQLGYWIEEPLELVEGDYHLQSQVGRWDPNQNDWVYDANTSSCIDAGDPNSQIGSEPYPHGDIINMGAYGGTIQASKSKTGFKGDFNFDGKVNFVDFSYLAKKWQVEESCIEDLTSDGKVDAADLGIFAKNWLWFYGVVYEWTEPVLVSELNDGEGNTGSNPCLSSDGLTMYFNRYIPGLGLKCIVEAYRDTVSGSFTSERVVSELVDQNNPGHVRAPWISNDQLRLYYQDGPGGQPVVIKMATRSDPRDTWTVAKTFDELSEDGKAAAPSLTADELIIVFHSDNKPGSAGSYDLWMATRSNTNDPFSNIRALDEVNTTYADMHPSISSDGLTLYFASNRNDGHPGYNIYKATRSSRNDPFGNIEYVEIGTDTFEKNCVHVTSYETTIYFNSDIAGETGIWVSRWK